MFPDYHIFGLPSGNCTLVPYDDAPTLRFIKMTQTPDELRAIKLAIYAMIPDGAYVYVLARINGNEAWCVLVAR